MMYPTISEYIDSIRYAEDNFATLTNLRPVLDGDGNPVMSSGNFAVVFKMQDTKTNKLYALKCFTREQERRAESYRLISDELEYVSSDYMLKVKYLDKELFVDTQSSDETEFSVVLMDWVEGITLDKWIGRNIGGQYSLQLITHQFCRMASWLLSQTFAHGDLKPDNIIVTESDSIVLVDYDGMYVPAMQGQKSRELGSPDYRHPLRTLDDFNEHIDDFSLAVIALQLAAIALDPTLYTNHDGDTLLLTEQDHRDLANSGSHHQLLSLLHNPDFERLYALYHIAHAQQTLTNVDPRAFTYPKPDKSIISLSTKVTDEDLANGVKDEYGAIYSPDGLRLLKGPDVVTYAIRPGTKVICDNSFSGAISIDLSFSCKRLSSITIPNSVTHIGHSAFSSCDSLLSITIPDSVLSIGNNPFSSSGICHINCDSAYFEADKYALYTKGKKKIISFFNKQSIDFTIPKTVTHIGHSAFSGCDSLLSITIPDSVTHIGNNAFSLCFSLISITIPDSVTHIGNNAFGLCISLSSLTIPDSVTHIGDGAFQWCESLSSIAIPNSVTYIGDSVFSVCRRLSSILIPRGSMEKFRKLLPSYYHRILVDVEWFIKAAEQGNMDAQLKLGNCYYNGQGVERDYLKAAEWYIKAAEQGNVVAQLKLGNCYYNGQGVERDYLKAAEWYIKAAEQGNVAAQRNLGICYYLGRGIEQDYSKAVACFTKAAEQGNMDAQLKLGNCYYNGQGVERDYLKAAEWYIKAAEQGNVVAQLNLGICYYLGRGIEQDYSKAMEWFTKAAEQGDANAQFNLGMCYEKGRGVQVDLEKAKALYQLAKDQNLSDARAALERVEKRINEQDELPF